MTPLCLRNSSACSFNIRRVVQVLYMVLSFLFPFPSREYQIGMDIRQCHGNMRHSRIVTFVPRYKLDNRTSHEIVFAQRYQIFDEVLREILVMLLIGTSEKCREFSELDAYVLCSVLLWKWLLTSLSCHGLSTRLIDLW